MNSGMPLPTKAGLLGLAGLALAASACSSSPHRTANGSTTTASTAPAGTIAPGGSSVPSSSSTSSSSPATVSPTTASTAPSGPTRCATGSLRGSLTGANGTAGSIYYVLVLTNTGSASCVIQGYPGISFVAGSDQHQVGAPAARSGPAGPAITLASGQSASAQLQITDASNYGTPCGITQTDGLRVYPPDQLASLVIAHADRACTNTTDVTLHVGALQPGRG